MLLGVSYLTSRCLISFFSENRNPGSDLEMLNYLMDDNNIDMMILLLGYGGGTIDKHWVIV